MFGEYFVGLSVLTGLDPIPLQNAACGLCGSVLSPVLIWLARATGARVFKPRQPVPFSDLATMILSKLDDRENMVLVNGDVHSTPVQINMPAAGIRVDNPDCDPKDKDNDEPETLELSGHLTKAERKAIYKKAAEAKVWLEDEEFRSQEEAAMDALTAPQQCECEESEDDSDGDEANGEPENENGKDHIITMTGFWDLAGLRPPTPPPPATNQPRPGVMKR